MDIDQLQKELMPVFTGYGREIVAAYLFGSAATGMVSLSSDIDIAVLPHTREKRFRSALKLRLGADICRKLGRNDIDLVLLSLEGNLMLNDEIIRQGIVLHCTNRDDREAFELAMLHRGMDFKLQRRIAMGV